jgi:hypothetical protein
VMVLELDFVQFFFQCIIDDVKFITCVHFLMNSTGPFILKTIILIYVVYHHMIFVYYMTKKWSEFVPFHIFGLMEEVTWL